MNNFLTKISELTLIHEVLLLSSHGDALFFRNKNGSDETDCDASSWNSIIGGLNSPVEGELFFEKGVYYFHQTDIGYVVVGMNGLSRLPSIKTACANIDAKLSDPLVCKKVLLKMLHEADETLKPSFVLALSPFAGDDIARKLIVLLDTEAEFGPEIRLKLLSNICQVLGQCCSSAARSALKKLLKDHFSGQRVLANDVRYTAQVALAQLDLDLPPESRITVTSPKEIPIKNELPDPPPSVTVATPAEKGYAAEVPEGQKIQDLLNQSKKGEAIALVLEQLQVCASNKQFDLADKLREWIMLIDSTSLRAIIHAAEIIEEEKNESLSNELLDIWNKLIGTLSIEDFSSLYYAMDHKRYDNGEIVVQQGDSVSTLFFVNRGRVELYSASHGGEYALKVVGAGEIFGAETFFDISIWTMNARSLGADLSQLSWDGLLKLKEDNPAIQPKLMDYCSQFKLTDVSFNKASTTRREFDRIKVSGKVSVALAQNAGDESLLGLKGILLDISRGGVAFSLRFSKKKHAIDLLQKELEVTVRPDSSTESIHRRGVVKAVKCNDFIGNLYTIHMRFEEVLTSDDVYQATGRRG